MADKTERLLTLGRVFSEECELHEDARVVLERATELAKTDLTTGMVTEFTELQGVMGKEYALLDGESPEVAEAIFEQYLPRLQAMYCLKQKQVKCCPLSTKSITSLQLSAVA